MSTPTLQELLTPRTREDYEQILLSRLQSEGFPVTDWFAGSVSRTIVKAVATALTDREELVRCLVSGQFLSLAASLKDATGAPIEDWCEALAYHLYGLQRGEATACRKMLTLTCAAGAGPHVRGAGEIRAVSLAGNYYTNEAEITIPDGGSVQAVFVAEKTGLLNDGTGTVTTLATPIPGVSVSDSPAKFSVPIAQWTGTGSVEPYSDQQWPSPPRTIKILFTRSGRVGEAMFVVTVFSNGQVTESEPTLVGDQYATGDVTLYFNDGPPQTNSFTAGDYWIISTPGESTIASGSDEEPIASLASRCLGRWPSLSAIPTESRYEFWVRQCSVDNALGVTRVTVKPSVDIAGVVNVYVADASGAVPIATITKLQQYLDDRATPIDRADVLAAQTVVVSVSGTVWVRRAIYESVRREAKKRWNSYLSNTPIGGLPPQYSVKVSVLNQILMDLGAHDTHALAINGADPDVDLVLSSDEVPAPDEQGTDALTWVQIP